MTSLTAHRSFLAETLARQSTRREIIDTTHAWLPQPVVRGHSSSDHAEAGPSKRNVINYVPEEETVRNDLTERYVSSGEFGSNYILGAADKEISLRKLMDLKSEHLKSHSHPPITLPLADKSPNTLLQSIIPARFDVILLRPLATWAETAELPIRNISADPSFVFLWVGKGDEEGLEKGRECFAKWGFRRAEDIVWVKTNRNSHREKKEDDEDKTRSGVGGCGLFASSKEHCLMGIRGTVRRSTDTRFVHCNVDTDIMVWEQGENERYPPYLYTLIENFCLGTRRLELFNDTPTPRRGWVTATTKPSADDQLKFDPVTYPSLLPRDEPRPVLPFHNEIDQLRPKSPPRRGGGQRGGHAHSNSQANSNIRPPRHNQQSQQQQMQMQQHMQMQAMQMQAQMHHMQMIAAMNMNGMNMNMNMGMGGMGMDPMMMAQMQMGIPVQDPQMWPSQDPTQIWAQGQGHGSGYEGGQPGGEMYQQGWQGPGDYQNQQFSPQAQGQGQGGQWQGQQFFQPGPGSGWGWQQ